MATLLGVLVFALAASRCSTRAPDGTSRSDIARVNEALRMLVQTGIEVDAERSKYAMMQKLVDSEKSAIDPLALALSGRIESLRLDLRLMHVQFPTPPIELFIPHLDQLAPSRYIKECGDLATDRMNLRRQIYLVEMDLVKRRDRDQALILSDLLNSYRQQIASHRSNSPANDLLAPHAQGEAAVILQAIDKMRHSLWETEENLLLDIESRLIEQLAWQQSLASRLPNDEEFERGPWRVVRVIDGDTIEVEAGAGGIREKVRLLSIDTPESHQGGYIAARDGLVQLLNGDTVELEFETPTGLTRDRFGRVLAFVFCDRQFVNLELILLGHAEHYTEYGPGRYDKALGLAESFARNSRKP